MAELNFPDPSESLVYKEAGITWTWNNTLGVWSTESDVQLPDLTYTYPGSSKTRSVQTRLTDYVSPLDFGAVGDGQNDDTAALRSAIETGQPVDGCGKIYRITDKINVSNLCVLKNCTITYPLLGNQTSGHILKVSNSDFLIDNVTFIYGNSPARTTTGSNGGLFNYRGLYITGGSPKNFTVSNCRFTGDGSGTHLYVLGASNFNIDGCKFHDSKAFDSAADDDLMHGVLTAQCSNFTISNCSANNLTHDKGSGYKNINTRGYAVSQSENFSIIGCHAEYVDQGFDMTGSGTNKHWTVSGCTADRCSLYGFKCANAPAFGIFANCVASKCGKAGFTVGASDEGANICRYIDFNGCKAIDSGFVTGENHSPFTFGWDITNGSGAADPYPLRVQMNDCSVIQESATVYAAFKSSVPTGVAGTTGFPARGAVCTNCHALESQDGLIQREFYGAAGPMVCQLRNATWAGGVNNLSPMNWQTTILDPHNMNDAGSSLIYIKETGLYNVEASFGVQGGGISDIMVQLIRNGAALQTTTNRYNGSLGMTCNLSWTGLLRTNQAINLQGYINGSAVYSAQYSNVCVTKIA